MASDTSLVPSTTNLLYVNSNCPALGSLVFYGGKFYKFVQYLDAVTYVASPAMILEWGDTACTTVTPDRAGGTSLGRMPAGAACVAGTAALIQNHYAFIQCTGVVTAGPVDGSIGAGEMVMPHATTDGGLDTWTGAVLPCGQALADDVSTTSVIIRLVNLI